MIYYNSNKVNKDFGQEDYWSESWTKHIEKYLASPPRAGIWLHNYFSNINYSVLECAAGSCRDSRYLFKLGYKSEGSDFDKKTLDYVKQRYPKSNFKITRQDAFKFTFPDDQFDIVFHNGLWVLFEDNQDLYALLKEQYRISKKYLVILVHNAENNKLCMTFKRKSKNDDLYNVRFFKRKELKDILTNSGLRYESYAFRKFGGPFDRLYFMLEKFPFISPILTWFIPKFYRFLPWKNVERIALIIKKCK